MTLGERIECILSECRLKQVEFAAELGVSANYVNQLIKGKRTHISTPLARLIQEIYGYSARWIMAGTGEKRSFSALSVSRKMLIEKIQKMSDEELAILLSFASYLESENNCLK